MRQNNTSLQIRYTSSSNIRAFMQKKALIYSVRHFVESNLEK
jgi:hypothetical protein